MKVLFVDDEPEIVEFYKVAARFHGFKDISTASDTPTAIEMAAAGPYGLITLDLRMPGAGGLEVAPTIRRFSPKGIITVISGHVPPTFPQAARDSIDVVLTKPIDMATFTDLLAKARRLHETLAEIQAMGIGLPPVDE